MKWEAYHELLIRDPTPRRNPIMVSPELLRRFPFFAGLSEEQINQIAMISEEERYEADEYLFQEGEEFNHPIQR